MPSTSDPIAVRGLTMAFGERVVMRDLTFEVGRGDIFFIMGPSGSGKSVLMRHLLGLLEPAAGEIRYEGERFTGASPADRARMLRRCGVTFQTGGLWSSLTLAENVAVTLEEYTDLGPSEIREVASLKLALVGLRGFEDYYPSEISGGMQKRAALARAIALDPAILFFDEPSSGLDPVSSRLLDRLIVELRDSLGATVVVVSHELDSILEIGTNSIFLDMESRTMAAQGNPRKLRTEAANPAARRFLNRGDDPREEAAR
jgi:phospholipid/cholesterol/gamma-HCH transport system ATP-binding protein